MSEYVRDKDGDVWEKAYGEDWWDSTGMYPRTRADLEAAYGPLFPCDSGGEPLTVKPSADDVRALLADAFEHFGSVAKELCGEVGANPFDAAKVTAQALRSGEITA